MKNYTLAVSDTAVADILDQYDWYTPSVYDDEPRAGALDNSPARSEASAGNMRPDSNSPARDG